MGSAFCHRGVGLWGRAHMSLLEAAVARYGAAERSVITRIPVHEPLAEAAYMAATALIKRIDERNRPAVWSSTRNAAAALRWSLVTRPLGGRHGNGTAALALRTLADTAKRLAGNTDPGTFELLQHVIGTAERLGDGSSQLADAITASAKGGRPADSCVVLLNTAARTEAEAAIGLYLPRTAFLTPRQFLTGRVWNRSVLVGVSYWYPDELFTAPRSRELVLVHHRWLWDRKRVHGLFGDKGIDKGVTVVIPPVHTATRARIELHSPMNDLDWSAVEPEGGKPQDSDPSDDVPAHLVLLRGGYGFYLEQDAETLRGLGPVGPDGQRIRQMPVADLTTDSVVLLRDGGSEREMLLPLITRILGEEEVRVRACQTQWKDALAARLASGGLAGIRRAVEQPRLASAYVRYWAGSTCISPRKSTFVRLLEHLGIEDPEEYVAAAGKLYSAHHKAGRQLAQQLMDSVDESVVSKLDVEDSVTLSVGPGSTSVRMTLFKIVAVSPDVTVVPAAALRTALKMKDTAWLA